MTTKLQEAVEEREDTVASNLRDTIEAARPEIDAATDAVEHITLYVALARFARAFDLTRPTLTDRAAIGVVQARNLLRRPRIQQCNRSPTASVITTSTRPRPATAPPS